MSPFKNQEKWGPSLSSPLPIHSPSRKARKLSPPKLAASHLGAAAGSTRARAIPGFTSPGTAIGAAGTTHHPNRHMGQPGFLADNEPVQFKSRLIYAFQILVARIGKPPYL